MSYHWLLEGRYSYEIDRMRFEEFKARNFPMLNVHVKDAHPALPKPIAKLIALALAFFGCAGAAKADQAIRAECEFQMARGVCTVQLDRSDYPAGATHLFIRGKRVQLDAMLMLRSTDNSMCRVAAQACEAGAGGTPLQRDICHIARARWTP